MIRGRGVGCLLIGYTLHVDAHTDGLTCCSPSGTEDVVRVYAEADTRLHADELAALVAAKVSRHHLTPPPPSAFVNNRNG